MFVTKWGTQGSGDGQFGSWGPNGVAVVALKDIAQDVTCPAGARVSAARTVLELAIKGVELEGLTARMEELELQVTRG
mgnify:CR=1 FL=1